MDPETAKLVAWIAPLATVVGAIVGGIGAILAGRVAARENQRGQRLLARDAHRRSRRERQVDGLLDLVSRRGRQYQRIHGAALTGDNKTVVTLAEEVGALRHLESAPWIAARGSGLEAHIAAFLAADMRCLETVGQLKAGAESPDALDPKHLAQTLHGRVSALLETSIALQQAAEDYIRSHHGDAGAWRGSGRHRSCTPPCPEGLREHPRQEEVLTRAGRWMRQGLGCVRVVIRGLHPGGRGGEHGKLATARSGRPSRELGLRRSNRQAGAGRPALPRATPYGCKGIGLL
jgi:hypothetical protein